MRGWVATSTKPASPRIRRAPRARGGTRSISGGSGRHRGRARAHDRGAGPRRGTRSRCRRGAPGSWGTAASSATKRPPRREDTRALGEHHVEIHEVAQRESADDAVEVGVAEREQRGVAAHERRAGVGGRRACRPTRRRPRRRSRTHRGRGRGRPFHTRGRAREPVRASPSAVTACAPPATVEPERDDAVHPLVPRREAVEHRFDRARASPRPPGASRARRGPASRVGVPAGLAAGRGELAGVADRLEVLLRHLEQHVAEVVRDERGDRGQQGAERGRRADRPSRRR